MLLSAPVARPRLRSQWGRSARLNVLLIVCGVFVALTMAVVLGSPLDTVDRDALHWQLAQRWPALRPWVLAYVMIGQRGPATLLALPWIAWRSWRSRSPRALIRLALALLLLNLLVGAVKTVTGRLGPQLTSHPTAVFDGGTIYPSGHVANVVMLFGVLAWTATRHRRAAIWAVVALTLTVGAGTVYLDTHWVTDVLGGALGGAIVLLLLPTLLPPTERGVRRGWQRLRTRGIWPSEAAPGEFLRLSPPAAHAFLR